MGTLKTSRKIFTESRLRKALIRTQRGFTLIEIAIVLVIVGLLLGGLLMPLATQVELRRVAETKKALEEINSAIVGFAMANGRLPCPADPGIATGAANAGLEKASCNSSGAPSAPTSSMGVVPWTTLGVSELDAWGRRFTYRVTPTFADASPSAATGCATIPTAASFSLCSVGDNTVTDGTRTIVTATPAVIVSHGSNGFGAYLSSGSQMGAATSADEQENYATPFGTFLSRAQSASGSTRGEFDDVAIWIVPGVLLNRMVAAGLLP